MAQKADLGACSKAHNASLREQYESAKKDPAFVGYEDEVKEKRLNAVVAFVSKRS